MSITTHTSKGFTTRSIHSGEDKGLEHTCVMPPIYMTTTFLQEDGVEPEYEYTRATNPNFKILESCLASLENAEYATVYSSGLGALTALISTLKPGDVAVTVGDVYGGTYRLFTQVFAKFGITLKSIPSGNIQELRNVLPGAKFLCFETPTNPLLAIYDIEELAKEAHQYGALCVVDNTFATPYLQNPLDLGADIVWHSTTKYIGGHSDVIGGAVMTNSKEIKDKMDFHRKAIGINPSPFDCWLLTRGVKTLALRMERHCSNAMAIAEFLQDHHKVKKVYYPGLASHKTHQIAKKQMRGYGGIVTVELTQPYEKIKHVISNMNYFKLAESLGGVESLISHPASMTHAGIPPAERQRLGINDNLIRLSVGIEDLDDLIDDLTTTLQ